MMKKLENILERIHKQNMTHNATRKTLSLQNFLSDAHQLRGISSTIQFEKETDMLQFIELSQEQ